MWILLELLAGNAMEKRGEVDLPQDCEGDALLEWMRSNLPGFRNVYWVEGDSQYVCVMPAQVGLPSYVWEWQ